MPRWLLLAFLLAACGDRDCEQAVQHGMDLVDAAIREGLAAEAPDWRDRALLDAKRVREEALGQCRTRRLEPKAVACTMAAKRYEELLRCPGWR